MKLLVRKSAKFASRSDIGALIKLVWLKRVQIKFINENHMCHFTTNVSCSQRLPNRSCSINNN